AALAALLDRPIAFHRAFVTVTGGVLPALMLSQAFYWHPRGSAADNWFYKTQPEWEKETGLSRWEQETARKKLRQIKTSDGVHIWEEQRRGVPARLFYRVNVLALFQCIIDGPAIQFVATPQSSVLDRNILDDDDATDLPAESPQSFYNTKNTTKNSR